MVTFSLCMIVKNEENVLARCLDSVADLMDEIIIVDTGSTDRTKEIAANYTDQIYDFAWVDDFAAARNFSFSKATMDYIYTPDADEMLDEENREELRKLKEALLPQIEIVQMKYRTVTSYNTVLNAATEYRPRLFKRLREFCWIDPVHETVRLDPVVFDSDIEILHMPETLHSKRDFSIFEKAVRSQGSLSEKLLKMYAMELEKSGDVQDLERACEYFSTILREDADVLHQQYAVCILSRFYRESKQETAFFQTVLKDMGKDPCAEVCCELGQFFWDAGDPEEAALWFYNAAYETRSVLDVHASGDHALKKLQECYRVLLTSSEDPATAAYYEAQLREAEQNCRDWHLPEEESHGSMNMTKN